MDEGDEIFEHEGYPIHVGASSSRAGFLWWYEMPGVFKECRDRALPTRRAALREGADEARRHAERLKAAGSQDVGG